MIGFSLLKFVNCKSCRLFIHKLGINWMTIDNYFDHISAKVLPACSKVFIYRFSSNVFPFKSKWVPKWVPWIFLKTVFHKIYLVYSWILCPYVGHENVTTVVDSSLLLMFISTMTNGINLWFGATTKAWAGKATPCSISMMIEACFFTVVTPIGTLALSILGIKCSLLRS